MLKITSSEYTLSCVSEEFFPKDGRPELLFLGRSNVGKSSFINALANRKKLAYTSSTPGKTQTLNFYLMNELFYFVDVPGYGYAKVSKKQREAFGVMIEHYLSTSKQLKKAFLLIDFRHGPTKDDILMFEFLAYHNISITVIGTKLDKVNMKERPKMERKVRELLQYEDDRKLDFIPISSEKRQNLDRIYNIIEVATR